MTFPLIATPIVLAVTGAALIGLAFARRSPFDAEAAQRYLLVLGIGLIVLAAFLPVVALLVLSV